LFKILHLIVNYVTRLFANILTFNGFLNKLSQFMTMTHVDVPYDQHLTILTIF